MVKWKKLLAVCLSVILLVTNIKTPIGAVDKTPTPTPTDEVQHDGKVSGKFERQPPYVITVEDRNEYDYSQPGIKATETSYLTLIGQCDDDSANGEWNFSFRFRDKYVSETEKMGELIGSIGMGIEVFGTGVSDATMKKPEKKKATPTPVPSDDDLPLASLEPSGPPVVNTCKFETTMALEIANTENAGSITGFLMAPNGESRVDANVDLLNGQGGGTVSVKALINVFDDDRVRVEFTVDGKSMYFDGVLTSEKELTVKRKESFKWPIWGVWTDINPYEPMPNVLKDLDALKENPDKKIAYPVGQWLMLKAGRKEIPSTYAFVQSTDEKVIFESGEIWPYPGSGMFVPLVRKELSPNLKEVISENLPNRYTIDMNYRTATDGLWVPVFGNLVRVRDAILYGTWSSAGDIPVPQKGQEASVPDGTWIEFSRDTSGSAIDNTISGYSGQSIFTRTIIQSGKVEQVDKGTAITIPLADEEMVHLLAIQSTRGDVVSELPDETLILSGYDKAAGTVELNQVQYVNVSGGGPGGLWCSDYNPTYPPDVAHGAFRAKDASGKIVDQDEGTIWIAFDNKAKTFTRTQLLTEPIGYLVESGKFRTVGGNVLVLMDMTASFYPDPEQSDLCLGFQNRLNTIGEQLLPFEKSKDGETLEIGGYGTLVAVPEK